MANAEKKLDLSVFFEEGEEADVVEYRFANGREFKKAKP